LREALEGLGAAEGVAQVAEGLFVLGLHREAVAQALVERFVAAGHFMLGMFGFELFVRGQLVIGHVLKQTF